ncbi:thiamine pyrophosphokinase [Nemania serpens]|nr:thiamine pyrophosphokinase [Nemania serpens]
MESHSKPYTRLVEWNPVKQLLGYPEYEFVLITLNQPIRDNSLFEDLWNSAETKIAADGGANQIYDLSKASPPENRDGSPGPGPGPGPGSSKQFQDLDTIIGDLDSLTDEARSYFSRSRIIRDSDQYSTDFAKAVGLARRESPAPGSRAVVCVGGLGGRVDQGLSQVHHLYLFQKSPTYADGRMYLVSGDSLSFVLKGGSTHRIRVREPGIGLQEDEDEDSHRPRPHRNRRRRISGDPFAKYVGIIPVGEPAVITTRGLEWDVEDWPTAFGGKMSTSNHVLPETEVVEVRTDKDVLFTIALKQGTST